MKKYRASLSAFFLVFSCFLAESAHAVASPDDILWIEDPREFVESLYEGVLGRPPRSARDWQSVLERIRRLRTGRTTRLRLFWEFINSDEYQASRWASLPKRYSVCWESRVLDPPVEGLSSCRCYQFAKDCSGYPPNLQFTGIPFPAGSFTFGEAAALARLYGSADREGCPHFDCAGGDISFLRRNSPMLSFQGRTSQQRPPWVPDDPWVPPTPPWPDPEPIPDGSEETSDGIFGFSGMSDTGRQEYLEQFGRGWDNLETDRNRQRQGPSISGEPFPTFQPSPDTSRPGGQGFKGNCRPTKSGDSGDPRKIDIRNSHCPDHRYILVWSDESQGMASWCKKNRNGNYRQTHKCVKRCICQGKKPASAFDNIRVE